MVRAEKPFAIVTIDLETSGTDPESHQILEIGAKVLRSWGGRRAEGDTFERGVSWREEAIADIGAAAVNGVWHPMLGDTGRSSLDDELLALSRFTAWLGLDCRVVIAGINPHFDREFLLIRGRKSGLELEPMFGHRVLDLHSIALFFALAHGKEATSLHLSADAIYEFFGEQPEARPHQALAGAEKENDLLRRLIAVHSPVSEEVFPTAKEGEG